MFASELLMALFEIVFVLEFVIDVALEALFDLVTRAAAMLLMSY